MAVQLFDRIARSLTDGSPRREALKGFLGSSLAALAARIGIDATTAKKKKKRCRKRLQSCGGKKKCCDKNQTACQEFPTLNCADFIGRRCCGQEGASCDVSLANCDCCSGLFCTLVDGEARCREPEP
jgi:hypothetical protein